MHTAIPRWLLAIILFAFTCAVLAYIFPRVEFQPVSSRNPMPSLGYTVFKYRALVGGGIFRLITALRAAVFPLALLSGWSLWWMAERRKERSIYFRTHCTSCNYDLRATPNRCPECGAVPKKIPVSN